MANSLSRIFLGASAALLLLGGAVHTLAFKKAVAAVAASDLAPFFGKALKGLWLIDFDDAHHLSDRLRGDCGPACDGVERGCGALDANA